MITQEKENKKITAKCIENSRKKKTKTLTQTLNAQAKETSRRTKINIQKQRATCPPSSPITRIYSMIERTGALQRLCGKELG